MTKLILGLLVAGALLLTYPVGKMAVDAVRANGITKQDTNANTKEVKLSDYVDTLTFTPNEKLTTVKDRLTLEAKNTLVLRGPVTGESVSKLIRELGAMSRNLSKSDTIYLVLDTPGGSIFDGMELIDYMEAIPQEIKTVTLFAASMGFQIVEANPGERLIARNGILMSHRARGGVQGQFDGELESEYRMAKEKIDYLDVTASQRAKLDLKDYKAKVLNEWWIHGFRAVENNVADKMVLISCGESMTGTDTVKINTFMGAVVIVFDKCPLIKEPISADFAGIRQDAQPYVKAVTSQMINNKQQFVKDFIVTNKFQSLFK